MYLLPNFQNPSGVTLSLDRRRTVIGLADRYGIPIVEDDSNGQLRYEGEHLPPSLSSTGTILSAMTATRGEA